ncbi:MAG: thioredoxin family protein [Candidatus Thorarchaeota archaeon]
MKSVIDLKWSDLTSPTMNSKEYLKIYGNQVKKIYDNYEPKSNILVEIRDLMKKKKEKLKILALGADWCPDCSRNVPSMIKIINSINDKDIELKILYGIIKNAFHKPEETIWHKTRSPPEATDPKFNLKAIPSFYFFNKNGEYLGIIIENPHDSSSLEEDILAILKSNL